jgi:hypothetical protein
MKEDVTEKEIDSGARRQTVNKLKRVDNEEV